MKITPVEPGHRIQLPADWAAELGLEHSAALEKTAEGILVRPCHPATWDEIFADKLPMGQEISSLDLSDVVAMISSSNPSDERGLDAMLIVYSLLEAHPASTTCEQFIRSHSGWFTTAFTLFEAKAILTKVYAVEATLASRKLAQFAAGPIVVTAIDSLTALAAMDTADTLGLDLTDTVLLQAVQARGALWLATDDTKLAQVCRRVGVTPETPIDAALLRQMVTWETANLPAKGLPRVLRQIHQWLNHIAPSTAEDFWSHTGGGSHLPERFSVVKRVNLGPFCMPNIRRDRPCVPVSATESRIPL